PSAHRLAINEAKLRIGLIVRLLEEVITQPRCVQSRERIALWHAEQQFTQRSFANFYFQFRVDGQFRLTQMEGDELRDGNFRQDVVRLDAQRVVRAGKAI